MKITAKDSLGLFILQLLVDKGSEVSNIDIDLVLGGFKWSTISLVLGYVEDLGYVVSRMDPITSLIPCRLYKITNSGEKFLSMYIVAKSLDGTLKQEGEDEIPNSTEE